jgi:hypothetical protein
MTTLKTRLLALETLKSDKASQLPVLVMRGPDEEARLKAARARWGAAELDTNENNAKYLG